MRKTLIVITLLLVLGYPFTFAQTWTKISNIADTVKVSGSAQINNQVLISGTVWGSSTVNHFLSTDGNTWSKLPTFSFAGNYLYGLKENNILLGGSFLDSKKLEGKTWTTSFPATGFAEFPNGTIIGGSGNFPDFIYQFSPAGVKGNQIGQFKFKFGAKYGLGNNGRLFLFSHGSGFGYIDQSDLSKITFPATLNGVAMTESSWTGYIIDDMVKTKNGILIATERAGYGIFRSTDNGQNWTTVLQEPSAAAFGIAINSKDEIFIVYNNKVRKSADLGLTYTSISLGLPAKAFLNDLFINANDELFVFCNANGSVKPADSGIYKYSDSILGLNSGDETSNVFNIYPNPAVNSVKIEIRESYSLAELNISNSLGEMVHSQIFKSDQTISLNQLQKGVYFVNLTINGVTGKQKLIMQ